MTVDIRADRPAFTGSALRDVVLEAAMRILDRHGLHLAPESISYARVFKHIEATSGIKVTRGSVHERIWASHDDFRRDVLAEVVAATIKTDYFLVGQAREQGLRDMVKTSADRRNASLSLLNLLSDWSIEQMSQSAVFQQVQSSKAIATRFNDPAAAAQMQSLLEQHASERLQRRRQFLVRLLQDWGLRPAQGRTFEETSDLLFSSFWGLLSGAFLNLGAGCDPIMDAVEVNFGEGSRDEASWRVFAVGVRGLFRFLLEVDPEPRPKPHPEPSPDLHPEPSSEPNPDPSNGTAAWPPRPETDMAERTAPAAPQQNTEIDLTDPVDLTELERGESSGRRTRAELRELVLRGGVETLRNAGLNVRPESLSYAAVFAEIYAEHGLVVNRASVHKRFWSSHTEFCMEVMGMALQRDLARDQRLVDAVNAIPGPDHDLDGAGPRHEQHQQNALDGLRAISRLSLEPMIEDPKMRRRMLIKSAIPDQPNSEAKTELKRILVETETILLSDLVEFLQEKVVNQGYEVRPELGLSNEKAVEVTAILIHILSVGTSFERLSGGAAFNTSIRLPRHDGSGVTDEWNSISVMARATFEMLYRPTAGESKPE